MRIGLIGLGAWGFCLARHLALNGHEIVGWSKDPHLVTLLAQGKMHPHVKQSIQGLPISVTTNLLDTFTEVDYLIESITTSGIRPVLSEAKNNGYDPILTPLLLTSKGIEQKSHLTLPDIIKSIFGVKALSYIAILSGPSFAQEVSQKMPTAVVCGSTNVELASNISTLFSNDTFRVYPNQDIMGVSLGGALKNIIAIACGVADGLKFGTGAKASVVTRGLHEIVKLATQLGASPQTLYGLSGLGDLYLTCSSPLSRNFRFGRLLSEGMSKEEAELQIGMVVEGAYTVRAAFELSQEKQVQMPIIQSIYEVIYEKLPVQQAAIALMQRMVKEEKL